jgi:N-acetylglucosamine-6-sulfatase
VRLSRILVVAPLSGLVLIAAAPGPTHPHTHVGAPSGASTPDIVLILTDDQRWDELGPRFMPNVQALLVDRGVTFSNAFVVNSLCCPSRASILTGQYSHTTGVYQNSGDHGGFSVFEDGSTIATWLRDAGYRTSLIGKYLNGYNTSYLPPGWDRWVAFQGADVGGAYYEYDLNIDGTLVHHGHEESDYSTDVLASEADSFIRTTDRGQPIFLYFAPFAPHTPYAPAPRHGSAFRHLPPRRPPNFNEEDVSDKPQWVQELPLLSPEKERQAIETRKAQFRTLLSVDDAVDTILTALSGTGRLSNTLVVYMSDNGLSLGEHRWNEKKAAYEEDIRVPLIARYDPLVPSARTDRHLVTNIDLAPTFADVAGVEAGDVEGMSLVPLLSSPDPVEWRKDFLVEHLGGLEIPTYCAVRSAGFSYVSYVTEEEELYDLGLDPYQLVNVAADMAYADVRERMRYRTQVLCDPPPPGPYART